MNDKSTARNNSARTVMVETVFPSMVNQYGTLFGGIALQWMDKSAGYARLVMHDVLWLQSHQIE